MTDPGAVQKALAGCDGVVHVRGARRPAPRRRTPRRGDQRARRRAGGGRRRRARPAEHRLRVEPVGVLRAGRPARLARAADRAAYHGVRALEGAGRGVRAPAAGEGRVDPHLVSRRHRRPRRSGHERREQRRAPSCADTGVVTSSGFQCVDVRDVAALHVKLIELPPGPHRYAAAAEMLAWADVYALMDRLTGTRVRRCPRAGLADARGRQRGRRGEARCTTSTSR